MLNILYQINGSTVDRHDILHYDIPFLCHTSLSHYLIAKEYDFEIHYYGRITLLFPTAAVALIRILNPEPFILLIERAKHPDDPWSGHLAFPGGRKESSDLNLLDTAIRETKEEIGLSLREHDCVRIGSHAVAGHYSGTEIGVALFMFELLELPETVKPCQKEVAMIHHLPEKTLLDPSMHLRDNFHPVMKNHFFPYIKISEAKCWGFTYECLIREYHLGEI